jgi:hypothetical protein
MVLKYYFVAILFYFCCVESGVNLVCYFYMERCNAYVRYRTIRYCTPLNLVRTTRVVQRTAAIAQIKGI